MLEFKDILISAVGVFLVIVMYGFIGSATYQFHESVYPGSAGDAPNTSVMIGYVWPIGLPATTGIWISQKVF